MSDKEKEMNFFDAIHKWMNEKILKEFLSIDDKIFHSKENLQ